MQGWENKSSFLPGNKNENFEGKKLTGKIPER
jgi:hypothetical protein